MSEMLDRVAWALRQKMATLSNPEADELARVAIGAMRVPTDEMCSKGYGAGTGDDGAHYDNRRELARGRVVPAWEAMIDAALS
ncbi:hypothetical protein [Bradyrhizobium elkanii]|uniref:hypothetical protein n=1 Tax=Bradyrhizobium elkanii TaxID=29448 RepID=UPI00272BF85D|nr:hypothetical protein [Bradyrhizobium elkanii]WLA80315.1 hypothetical protein QNJ99_33760 [Bradyrhizobium elkanii]